MSDFCTLFVYCIIFFKYLCFWSSLNLLGVPTRERDVDAQSPKISASFSEVMSDVVSPIESRWQVLMGPAFAVLFAVFMVSRPVTFDFGLMAEAFLGICFSVSKSLKRPFAIV